MLEIIIVAMAALIIAAVCVGVYTGRVEVRPFRVSAIAFGLMLLVLVWLGLQYDLDIAAIGLSKEAAAVVNLVIDVSVFMVAVTGYVTGMVKLSDDGGESDGVKIVRMFLDAGVDSISDTMARMGLPEKE